MGYEKPQKTIKCNKCKERFDSYDGELVKINGKKFIICPYCGTENKVK